MENETPNEQSEMTAEDFIAAVKRLKAHAENQADQAFKVGDRKQFDIWDTRASKLKGITSMEELPRKPRTNGAEIMTFEIPCQQCSGAGFFGGNGPTVERKCEACNGTGVLVEDGLVNVRPVPKSVFATMTRAEGRTLFNQMEENRMHRETFGI